MFESVDPRTHPPTGARTDDGSIGIMTISSPCEPAAQMCGSDELKYE